MTFLNDNTATVTFVSNGGGITSSTLNSGLAGCGSLVISGNSSAVTPTCPLPDAAVSSSATTNTDTYISGTDPYFKVGNLVNSDSDADGEFVVVDFNAILDNSTSGNSVGTNRNNTFTTRISSSTVGATSSTAFTRIVEPSIATVSKTITTVPNDAGDTVAYRITFSNASGTNNTTAFDVRFVDIVPSSVSLTLASVTVTPAGGTTGVTNNSSGNTVDITLATMPTGGSVTITYVGIVNRSVAPGQNVPNTGNVTYTSLPGTNGTTGNATGSNTGTAGSNTGERTGAGGTLNKYFASGTTSFTIDNPILTKSIVATSEASTTGSNLTIGEIVRYRLQISIPESTDNAFRIIDTLPAGFTLLDNSQVRLAFVTDVPVTAPADLAGAGNSAVPPTFVLPASRISTVGQVITFNLGDLVINDNDANQELIVLEFNALVNNSASNLRGTLKTNTFKTEIDGLDRGTAATVNATIVEPTITNLAKSVIATPGDAGDTVTYRISFSNSGTATAFDLPLLDTLPADLTLNLGSISVTPSTGVTNNSSGNTLNLVIASLAAGGSVTVDYSAILNQSVTPRQVIPNTASLTYTSLPGASGTTTNATGSSTPGTAGTTTGERTGTGGVNTYSGGSAAQITVNGSNLTKSLASTSAAHTTGSNVTIGEVITYALSVTLPEGTTPSLIVTDTLPAGLVYVAGSAALDSSGFGGTIPAPTVTTPGNSVIFSFGPITVTADNNINNNSFGLRLRAGGGRGRERGQQPRPDQPPQ